MMLTMEFFSFLNASLSFYVHILRKQQAHFAVLGKSGSLIMTLKMLLYS